LQCATQSPREHRVARRLLGTPGCARLLDLPFPLTLALELSPALVEQVWVQVNAENIHG
jgi:hypothetical protein